MAHESNDLKQRWLSVDGKTIIDALINTKMAKTEFDLLRRSFYGEGDGFIVSETRIGLDKYTDFRGVNLSRCDLKNCVFLDEFSCSDFSFSNLDGAIFFNGKFYYANFEGAHALNKRPQFAPAFAQNANFKNVRFKKALFSQSDLRGCDFSGAYLEGCEFNGALMQNAIFNGTQMINCDIGDAWLSAKEKDAEWFKNASFDQTFIRWE